MARDIDAELGAATSGNVYFAAFWLRFLASLADLVMVFLATWGVSVGSLAMVVGARRVLGLPSVPATELIDPESLQILVCGTALALGLIYATMAHFLSGATLGKACFGLEVVSRNDLRRVGLGRSALRALAWPLSALPLGAGFLIAAIRRDHRALHDLIAGTAVIRRPFSPPPPRPSAR